MMIQINNLVKKFDDFTALDGVNMNVEKGAVYGLVGPNGAGKSTLIRHITGVMRQDAGEVFIDGEPVYENARIPDKLSVNGFSAFFINFKKATLKSANSVLVYKTSGKPCF